MDKPSVLRVVLLFVVTAFCLSCTPEAAVSEPASVDPAATVAPPADTVTTTEEKASAKVETEKTVAATSGESAPAASEPASEKESKLASKKSAAAKPAPAQTVPPVPEEVNETTVVASIRDWKITGEELKKRVYTEANPDPYDMTPRIAPVDLNDVVFLLLGEKALAMEAHQQGQHKEGTTAASLERYSTGLLINQLMSQVVKEKDVQVSEAEVKAYQQIKPELDDARAKTMLMRLKAQKLANDFITKLRTSRHVQKKTDNFTKVAALHQRLLLHPKEARTNNVSWILRKQIQNELTAEEKQLVLATYDGGVYTAEDWFNALHQLAPPGRPKNLGTVQGVAAFLDRSLRQPLLRAEAIDRGLDKDAKFIESVRAREYSALYSKVHSDMNKAVPDPNDAEIAAHYATIKEKFGREDSLKAQLIWCENKKVAAQAKAEIDQGKGFAEVQAKYALDQKNLEPRMLSMRQEGMFWQEIWTSEPNQILGPILGFYDGQFKWRIIKTLEKQTKDAKELDDNIKGTLKWEIKKEQVNAQLRERMKKLLQAYPHKVYQERLKAFEPARTP